MSVLRAIRKLVLGETWLLPIGVAAVAVGAVVLAASFPEAWERLGGFAIAAAVVVLLVVAVARGARPR